MLNIFTPQQDISKNALNWKNSNHQDIYNMLLLGEGYINSADELIQICLKAGENKKADSLILPIFFNLNHGIELYLKAILYALNALSKSERILVENHNLETVYQTVVTKIHHWLGEQEQQSFEKKLTVVRDYIVQFYDFNATENFIVHQSTKAIDLHILYCFVKNINRVLHNRAWLYCSQLR